MKLMHLGVEEGIARSSIYLFEFGRNGIFNEVTLIQLCMIGVLWDLVRRHCNLFQEKSDPRYHYLLKCSIYSYW